MNKHFNTIALLFQQRNILVMNLQKRLLSLSNVIILAFLLATASNLQAQVGIASTSITADASAMLEVQSTSKGLLTPRMTNAQKQAISSPATGLTIYQTDSTAGYYVYTGSAWTRLLTATVPVVDGGDDIQKKEFSTKNVFDKMPLGIFYVDKKKEIIVEAPKADTTRFIIYFAFDKYKLTNKAKRILDQAIELLKKNPELKAILDGHTDLWGGDDYNLDLSNSRVKEACKYFSNAGLNESQTDCSQYYGKKRPVYNTLNRVVSGKNRRVEILVTNK